MRTPSTALSLVCAACVAGLVATCGTRGASATTAPSSLVYVPSVADIPGGTPLTSTGTVALAGDTMHNVLAFYQGSSYVSAGPMIGALKSANMNSTADQAIPMLGGGRYIITQIVVENASTSLTIAAGGVYTTTSKGGTAIVSAAQVYSGLTGSSKFLGLTLAAILTTDVRTESTLYLSLTTAQGGAATADLYIFGQQVP